ncbi:hypothetical protein C1645_826957 [Glomus cerebriforme]|uniref:Protein kinase domain-containing protein n=1 Tax=Glomus cerebriforme TaxID=658196 RepID=A0A397STV5_9GLOM|nr:hypothetical protein C1645_826957 [Glomus cerebriforme]
MADEFLNEVSKIYSINHFSIYGISQNPDTKVYIIVLLNDYFNVESEKIDDFIHEMQLKINTYYDIIFEWIPYNQFNEIKEISRVDSVTLYSSIWKDGPLHYDESKLKYTRISDKDVALKCFNLQNITDEFLNMVRTCSINLCNIIEIYGISQNPDTKDYIIILHNKYFDKEFAKYCVRCGKIYTDIQYKWCKLCQIKKFTNWTSGDEKIDDLIQEMQLKINDSSDIVFEWIPYNQFNDIKEIDKDQKILCRQAW